MNDILDVRRLSKQQLAEMLDVSPSALGKWAAGRDEPRDVRTVFAMERALRVAPGSLSAFLGYCPCDRPSAPSVEEAILAADELSESARRGLLGIYQSLVVVNPEP